MGKGDGKEFVLFVLLWVCSRAVVGTEDLVFDDGIHVFLGWGYVGF